MRKERLLIALLVFTLTMSLLMGSAYALPTLLTDEPSKLKFTNFEYLYDNNNNLTIDAGDTIAGIVKITSIWNVDNTTQAWAPTANVDELTGIFQFSVIDGSISAAPGSSGTLAFDLQSGDFFRLYYDTDPNWDPSLFTSGTPEASDAWKNAADGDLWVAVEYGDYIEGYNESSISVSFNRNWMDVTTNNTGYDLEAQYWLSLLGMSLLHPVTDGDFIDPTMTIHSVDHLSIFMLESHLYGTDEGIWMWRSEDPGYLYAVPEPTTLLLLGAGLIGVAAFRRRFKK